MVSANKVSIACSLVVHDESLAAPLRLIWAGLDLHTPPFAPPPYSVEGAASPGAVPAAAFTTSRGDGMSPADLLLLPLDSDS